MTKYTFDFSGQYIVDKHTHDEVTVPFHPYQLTVTIVGTLYEEFRRRYGTGIKDCTLRVELECLRNEELLEECRDPFKNRWHLSATLNSLDQIVEVTRNDGIRP